MPDFKYERAALKDHPDAIVAGIDEVGCAPLAGPVVAAAVILDQKKLPKALRDGLDDSKKLSLARREEYYALLLSCGAAVCGVGRAEVHEIDSLNIHYASHLAWRRALDSLGRPVTVALIDGNKTPKDFPCAVRTIVKGDGKSLSIAAASVIAKVTRDRYMKDLAREHPGYGWETNVGYPTKAHRDALIALGLTPHHRRSFGLVRERLAGPAPVQTDLPI
ncbi:MAG: ribonuclease HII [Rhodospirillaceae bacterium]|nr:ribonuclease HII [Rhodospirillaceae bacterium]